MSGRTSIVILLTGGLLLAGCGDADPTDPWFANDARVEPATAAALGTGAMVPIRWTYRMTSVDTNVIFCENSDGSAPWLPIQVTWNATGRMSHLGELDAAQSRAQFTWCLVNIVGGFPVSAVGGASVQMVGANGDAVFFEGELTLSFADYTATGQWTFTGGTGRFAGASGWIETFEAPSADGSASEGSGVGWITPPGMLKN